MLSNAAGFESMARTYINNKISGLPTLEEIKKTIDEFYPVGNIMFPVSESEFQKIRSELIEEMAHTIGAANILRQRRDNEQSPDWYTQQEIQGYYWPRFKTHLKKKRSPDIVEKLDRLTDQIMNCLADPNSELDLQKRGLMMGEVQSGKTEAYTALCNKAADCGYKVIIVLTGITESLRTQTQSRLDSELVGLESRYSLEQSEKLDIKNIPMGVGTVKHDQDKIINRFTSVTTDFNKNTIKNNGLSLSSLGKTEPSLFVIKKNSSVMRNLYHWLTKDSDILDLPLLLIDDEADNASLNTNSSEHDPTAINSWINKILRAFTKASYLGVTATPFANIFVNDGLKEDGAAKDLFPRDFLIMLSVPDNYIGAKDVFGYREKEDSVEREAGDFAENLIPIENDEQENYFRYKHKITLAADLNDLPDSLYEAIRYYILVSAIKDFQKQEDKHLSMMVNVSRFTGVQDRTAELIQDYLDSIVSSLINYSKIDFSKALEISTIAELQETWNKFNLTEVTGIKFRKLLKSNLSQSARKIVIRQVNQNSESKTLDYHNYKDKGMRVIAVGGNNLSRGLTLEGLIVSYFYRNTLMYDSLLQMGRWFGYRTGYEDLFKIWLGEDSIGWFGEITDAYYELKELIGQMEKTNCTPESFGLKIRKSSQGLLVTARNKMRTGSVVTMPITVSGRMIETPRLIAVEDILEGNNRLCLEIIQKLQTVSESGWNYDETVNAYVCRGVPAKEIADLVANYQSHPWNLNFNSIALSKYIQNGSGYEKWDVGIPFGNSDEEITLSIPESELVIRPEVRKITRDESVKNMLKVSGNKVRVGQGGCSKIGLSEEQIKKARASTEKRYDKTYLTVEDRNPIALIHLLENSQAEQDNLPKNVFALGLGFPGGSREETVDYVVNTTELRSYLSEDWIEDLEEPE